MSDKNVNQLAALPLPIQSTDQLVVSRDGINLLSVAQEYILGGLTTTFSSVAALLVAGVPIVTAGQVIVGYLQGYYVPGDGGGGSLSWVPTSTLTSNNGTVFNPTGNLGNGRWLRPNQQVATVLQFGAVADSTSGATGTDNTAIFAMMVNVLNEMVFPAPLTVGNAYAGSVSVRRSNFTIRWEGQNVILRSPAGTNYPGGALELGNTALGNSAPPYTGISLIGSVKLDGNHANTLNPGGDLTGWGLAATNISHSDFGHVSAINAWNGGAGFFINSAFNTGDFFTSGNLGTNGEPGLDVNATAIFNTFTHRSSSDQFGIRFLTNCWGNIVQSTISGAIGNAASFLSLPNTNFNYGNDVTLTLINCLGNGVAIGPNNFSSTFRVTAYNNVGPVVIEQGATDGLASNVIPNGNTYIVTSYKGQQQCVRCAGNSGSWTINSNLDGRSGAQGSYYAIDNYGNNNKFVVNLQDSATWQVRGVVHRNGANDNELVSYNFTNTADPYNDAGGGLRNRFSRGTGLETVIASASTIVITALGNMFPISGTATINNINTPTVDFARPIVLYFQAAATVADNSIGGGNVYLNGHANFVATAKSTLSLSSIDGGVTLFETGRSIH